MNTREPLPAHSDVPQTPRTAAGRRTFGDLYRHRMGGPSGACRAGFTFKVSDCSCGLLDAILAIEAERELALWEVADRAAEVLLVAQEMGPVSQHQYVMRSLKGSLDRLAHQQMTEAIEQAESDPIDGFAAWQERQPTGGQE